MFNSDVLEVGVGLVLFFLLASLIASAVREMIETALKTRAMELERGIRELLDDPRGHAMAKSFFEHAHIYSLFAGVYDPEQLKPRGQGFEMPRAARRRLPTYIPAGQFATTLIDLVGRGSGSWPYPVNSAAITLETLRQRAAGLHSPRLQRAVLSAIDHARDLTEVRKNLEEWFNGTMDRVSGWYKRRTQYWLLAIGVVAAIVFNLDALTVADRLINDHSLRAAAVAHAEKITGDGKPMPQADLAKLRGELSGMGYPIGWRYVPWKSDGKPAPKVLGYEIQLPLPAPQTCLRFDENGCAHTKAVGLGEVLGMITGWLITAAAISFGAPFWFDVLNKIMVIRSTVKPREKSRDEGSEDRQPKSSSPPPDGGAESLLEAFGASRVAAPVRPAPPEVVKPLPVAFEPEAWRPGFSNKGEVL
ncbi:MAG: hypothetical protein JWR84_531 [Caulobacter sp.]|nr:hypothetical protein [Caulobacter sp.]